MLLLMDGWIGSIGMIIIFILSDENYFDFYI